MIAPWCICTRDSRQAGPSQAYACTKARVARARQVPLSRGGRGRDAKLLGRRLVVVVHFAVLERDPVWLVPLALVVHGSDNSAAADGVYDGNPNHQHFAHVQRFAGAGHLAPDACPDIR